jgi:PilZ domain
MPDPADRRASERLAVSADVACTLIAPVVENFGAAKIKNVSLEGIGLVVARRVEPGTLLAVTLSNPARGFTKTVMVRVAHATPQPGGCLIGGTFDVPLSYQELTTLVM